MAASYGDVTVRYIGDIAVVEMLGEQKRLNTPFLNKLDAAYDKVLSNKNCKGMITMSTGKIFSNGVDLEWIIPQGNDIMQAFAKKLCDLIGRIMTFPLPTIAAVNGHAFAGGAVLAMAHDYRVMRSQKGWICLNEIFLNMMFPDFLLRMLRMKIPSGATQTEAIALGKRYTSEEGKRCGIVQEICEPEDLESTAVKMARNLVQGGAYDRDALHQMKMDLYQPAMKYIDHYSFGYQSKI